MSVIWIVSMVIWASLEVRTIGVFKVLRTITVMHEFVWVFMFSSIMMLSVPRVKLKVVIVEVTVA